MCGRNSELFPANIEGTELNVCQNCAKYGRIIKKIQKVIKIEEKLKSIEKENKPEIIETIVDDYSQKIRNLIHSLHRDTMICGYANGIVGYIPTRQDYEHPGEEGIYRFFYQGDPAPFGEELENILMGCLEEMVFKSLNAQEDNKIWNKADHPPNLE